MAQCSALIKEGTQCTRKPKVNGLCGIHNVCRIRAGPHHFEVDQLKIAHAKQRRDLHDRIIGNTDHADMVNFERRVAEFREANAGLLTTQREEMQNLRERHRREIGETGVNPDAQADANRAAERAEAARRREARREQIRNAYLLALEQRRNRNNEQQRAAENAHIRVIEAVRNGGDVMAALNAWNQFAPAPAPDRRLRDIAEDRQNVHTTEIVEHTKNIVTKIRMVPVPDGYRWNKHFVSPTIGEIIAECKLTSHAAAQMFNKYVSSETIYEMEEGIYGKVLDSVWQFVKNSPDKADLCKIVKQELEDNIGMCAQGNLSRICNIVAGYMDGVGSQESVAEKLGRLFPALMDIDDDAERRRRGEQILMENMVPDDQWDNWLEAL